MRIIFATNNKYKISEITTMLLGHIDLHGLEDISCYDDLPENQNTLQGNALDKAMYVAEKYNVNCLSDDTGLEIESLDGNPGVFSARYAGPDCSAEANISKVLNEMQGFKNRNAKFITVICLILDKEKYFFRGEVMGRITLKRRGSNGFGYDSIFQPVNSKKTFAEMSSLDKSKISHRSRAIKKLVKFLDLYLS